MLSEQELKALYQELSPEERLGQLLQLNGSYFGADGQLTGAATSWKFNESDVKHCGSVLNVFGADRIRVLQAEHMKHNRVPLLFAADVMCGYGMPQTIPLALACSFDPDLVRRSARSAAEAATADGIHLTYSPMVDISRDARWGRCSESYGEDVLLNCKMAAATVAGYQGDRSDAPDSLSACIKHFAAYGYGEAGRDYNNAELSERTLRAVFLPAYRAAIDAGAEGVMPSFNSIGGVPTVLDRRLMRGILREEWGFDGVTVSDYCSILQCTSHGAANTEEDIAKFALEAGVDIDMMDYIYTRHLPGLIEAGKDHESLFEEAVMRVLRLKNKKGLLEDPFLFLRGRNTDRKKMYDLAVEGVVRSCVLLKNEEKILPLSKEKKVALIGPFAVQSCATMFWGGLTGGTQYGRAPAVALEEFLGVPVRCEPGCATLEYENFLSASDREKDPCYGDPEGFLQRALEAASTADTVVMMLGEHQDQAGESRSRSQIALPEIQMELFRKVRAVNSKLVTIVFCARPVELSEISQYSKALMIAWKPGVGGSEGLAKLLTGEENPSAKLSMSFPYNAGQCPIHYDLLPTGHPSKNMEDTYSSRYVDVPNSPLYPFGFGLSYTGFAYSAITADSNVVSEATGINLSVTVTNTGDRDGEEIVQLYLQDRTATLVSRPTRELKDFRKIHINSGESVTVTFTVCEEQLRYWNYDCQYVSEPGRFTAYIGPDSRTDNKFDFELI